MPRIASIIVILAAASACDRSKIDESHFKEVGAQAVLPFKKNLKAALTAGLEEGPQSAIAACRVEAPRLAQEASTGEVRVGRSSSKLRNPDNAPKPWMEPFLARFEADPESREPAVVAIDSTTVGYVEPIFVQPLCVACHGSDLDPDLKAKLDALYPDDRATGYVAGDLRGVFWAEIAR